MATPPLPDVPCVRARLIYDLGDVVEQGSRFYLSYSGSAPTGANCSTLASDIASAWSTNLASLVGADYALKEVDVLDIATDSGNSGSWTGSNGGTRTGTAMPVQTPINIEYDISRRYRGGKPRMYLPGGTYNDFTWPAQWGSSFVTATNTGIAAFFAAIEALSVGAMGTLQHVNLSFYQGYRTRTTGGGQTTFAPKYRATAVHDNVTGYNAKAMVSSQRRRRTATTP